jgi:hypothetical protein
MDAERSRKKSKKIHLTGNERVSSGGKKHSPSDLAAFSRLYLMCCMSALPILR